MSGGGWWGAGTGDVQEEGGGMVEGVGVNQLVHLIHLLDC